jgi:hypothetical protein
MTVTLIKQKDVNGCCIACIAMVTNESYDIIKNFFLSLKPNTNFERHGICWDDIAEYLNHKGYTYQFYYRARLGIPDSRPVWPLKPFAPIHIMNVMLGTNNSNSHAIVMDNNGIIYDPQFGMLPPNHYQKNDTGWMMGIWPPTNKNT